MRSPGAARDAASYVAATRNDVGSATVSGLAAELATPDLARMSLGVDR